MNDKQKNYLEALTQKFPGRTGFKRAEMLEFGAAEGFADSTVFAVIRKGQKLSHGFYDFAMLMSGAKATENVVAMPKARKPVAPAPAPLVENKPTAVSETEAYIPPLDAHYVKWGHYADVKKIVQSGTFFPTFITGLSGNGKTMMVEQVCAELKRKFVRVQITPETDETDLIGGFTLVDGATVFAKGPVIAAMEAGAILLIDEIDRGSNKLMALQGILEGKPFLIKKTGEVVRPAPGFNIIATANTKGQGSDDGRFIAATVIDEAFLERFTITIEQPYPEAKTELRIVTKHMERFGEPDADFAEKLVKWSTVVRKTYEDGGITEMISTRRLCHIVHTNSIFGKRAKAVELCVSRFDADTRAALLDLYKKVDTEADKQTNPSATAPGPDFPF